MQLKWNNAAINAVHAERNAEDFYVLGNSAGDANETENVYSSLQFSNSTHWNKDNQTHYSIRYYEDLYYADSVEPVPGRSDFEQQSKSIALSLHNSQILSESQNLLYGMEYRHVHVADSTIDSSVLGKIPLTTERQRDIAGIYAQHQWQATPADTFTTGIRFDDYSKAGGSWSPRLGWVHALSDQQAVKLLYGQAFRAPTTNEQSLISLAGSLHGNPSLDPETIKTWEAIWSGNWSQHSVSLTLFHNTLQDAIVRDIAATPDTFINAPGDEHSQGMEIEYIGQLSHDWQWRAGYSTTTNLADSDATQADRLASLILNYEKLRWNANVSATHASSREMQTPSAPLTLDDYWLLNSKLQYQLQQGVIIYLQCKNLLDESYETPYRGDGFTEGLPNRRREVSLGFHWRFE